MSKNCANYTHPTTRCPEELSTDDIWSMVAYATSSLSFQSSSADMDRCVNVEERRRMNLVLRSHIKLCTAALLVTLAIIYTAYGQEIPPAAGAGDTTTATKSPDKSIPLHTAVQSGDVGLVENLL